jgi:hypothetical protein
MPGPGLRIPNDNRRHEGEALGLVTPMLPEMARWTFMPPQPSVHGPYDPAYSLTPEARAMATYGAAAIPTLAPYLPAMALAAASPPFVSYALSPVTRQRFATQAQQAGHAWDWAARSLPYSVPSVAKWFGL